MSSGWAVDISNETYSWWRRLKIASNYVDDNVFACHLLSLEEELLANQGGCRVNEAAKVHDIVFASDDGYDNTLSNGVCDDDKLLGRNNKVATNVQQEDELCCCLCAKTFATRTLLKYHRAELHSAGPPIGSFQCPHCRRRKFCHKFKLTQHAKKCSQNPDRQIHPCSECNKKYYQLYDLRAHVRTVHTKTSIHCSFCKKSFNAANQVANHEPECALNPGRSNPFQCGRCQLACSGQDEINKHYKNEHPGVSMPYTCKHCCQGFILNSKHRMHQTRCKLKPVLNPVQCHHCGECNFKTTIRLQEHIQVKHAVGGFSCSHCRKRFSLKRTMSAHSKQCDQNPERSKSSAHLCHICSREFKQKSSLVAHQIIHKADKSFVCTFCTRSFKRASKLQEHKDRCSKNADRKQPRLSCPVCLRRFVFARNLREHERLHTGEKPYHCLLCDERLRLHIDCSRHIRRRHLVGKPVANVHYAYKAEPERYNYL